VTFFGSLFESKTNYIQIIHTHTHTHTHTYWMNLKQIIRKRITSIDVSEIRLVQNNLFKRLEACLRAEGRHSKHLL
jgi:hypothetical protein